MANVEVGTTRLLSEKFLLGKNAKNTGTWKIGENWFDYNCRKTVSLKKKHLEERYRKNSHQHVYSLAITNLV